MVLGFRGTIVGINGVQRGLRRIEDESPKATDRAMARIGLGGQAIVRGHARGRPGPRAITGDFNRSISQFSERRGLVAFAVIGTNAAQARRLEYGFTGIDVLGRDYDQPPYPYAGPSVPEIRKLARVEVLNEIGRIF